MLVCAESTKIWTLIDLYDKERRRKELYDRGTCHTRDGTGNGEVIGAKTAVSLQTGASGRTPSEGVVKKIHQVADHLWREH